MLARRNWLLRASIFINAAVLLYFASYLTISKNGPFDVIDDVQLQSINSKQSGTTGGAEQQQIQQQQQQQDSSMAKDVVPMFMDEPKQIFNEYDQQPSAIRIRLQPDQRMTSSKSDDGQSLSESSDANSIDGNVMSSGQTQQERIINYSAQQAAVLSAQQQQMLQTKQQLSLQSQPSIVVMPANTQGTTTNTQVRPTKLSTTLKVPLADSSGEAMIVNDCPNVLPNMAVRDDFTIKSSSLSSSSSPMKNKQLNEIIQCNDQRKDFRVGQKGDFWVLYNYVPAARSFHCWESITYTTHADFTFLDNLQPLVERWRGPISLALYAPGTDFGLTLTTIRYLRKCTSPLIAELVTFHIYFGSKHVPKIVPPQSVMTEDVSNSFNCSDGPPWNKTTQSLYRMRRKLLYPVNVGRNIARGAAETYYILPSDIELYPSPGIIGDFLEMIRRQDPPLSGKKPKVFCLAIFEVDGRAQVPINKKQLVSMLKNNTAITFHKRVCPGCHNVPKSKEWIAAPQRPGLHVFHVGKRLGSFVHWEPIFIGTNNDPFYDERLSWEGRSDKMTQGYVLCVLDYEFHLLDNAFLVHKPGIKTLKKDTARDILTGKTNALIRKVIFPELKALYGTRKGCAV